MSSLLLLNAMTSFRRLADKTSSQMSSTHRIRIASSPSGSLLLFFSASLAFFFFFKLILSFSLLVLTRCSWCVACCIQALALLSLSVTLDRCCTLSVLFLFARCCLTLLTTRITTRGSSSRSPMAMATTAQSHAGVGSLSEIIQTIKEDTKTKKHLKKIHFYRFACIYLYLKYETHQQI